MKEELLYYLWKSGRLFQNNLRTTKGQEITVIKPGYRNLSGGPDFLDAKLKIGEITWHGQIEFHLKSSDWDAHKHHLDPNYNSVILHVVMRDDKPIFTNKGSPLPTLELEGYADENLLKKYSELQKRKGWVACDALSKSKDLSFCWPVFLSSLGIERLEQKSEKILFLLNRQKGDWDAVVAVLMARYLLGKANGETAVDLLTTLPYKLIHRYAGNLTKLESLLFGQAGFLQKEIDDPYYKTLKNHYNHLKKLHHLQCINPGQWKFMTVRPPAFPTIRLSQWCGLFSQFPRPLSLFLNQYSADDLRSKLRVKASPYWNTRYTFGKKGAKKRKGALGKSTLDNLILNVAAPVLFAYSMHQGKDELREKALEWIESIKPEKNSIISKWKKREVPAYNALDSQALIQLKKEYCDKSRCLECAFGSHLLGSEKRVAELET